MAKRYNKKSKNKKKFLRYLICLIIILIIGYTLYYNFIKKDNNQNEILDNAIINKEQVENKSNVKYSEDNDKKFNKNEQNTEKNVSLSSDVFIPKDLDSEVRNNFANELKNSDIVKIHYKLKSLEEGTAELYYKLDKNKMYLVQVDISSKKILKTDEVEDKELSKKSEIVNYLNEDIKNDFEQYKNELNIEGSILNIIISNTEIVINVSYEG